MPIRDGIRQEIDDAEERLAKIRADQAEQKLKAAQAARRLQLKEAREQMKVDSKQAFIYRQAETQQDIYLGRVLRAWLSPSGGASDQLRARAVKDLRAFVAEDERRGGALNPLLAVLDTPPAS